MVAQVISGSAEDQWLQIQRNNDGSKTFLFCSAPQPLVLNCDKATRNLDALEALDRLEAMIKLALQSLEQLCSL